MGTSVLFPTTTHLAPLHFQSHRLIVWAGVLATALNVVEELITYLQSAPHAGSAIVFISKISELKNAGVWRDFTASPDLVIARDTLIYGFNGSGKTTLSRVFASIQAGCLDSRLPTATTFKVEMSDGSVVTQSMKSNPFGHNLLVFNSDFVARHFEWDASASKGIAYISEKKVDARKEFDRLVPQLAASRQLLKAKESAKEKAEKDIADLKTRIARSIREVASSNTYTQSYDARKIHGHYSKTKFSSDRLLSGDDLRACQNMLQQREPLPTISFSPALPDGVTQWFRSSITLLGQTISAIALKEFEAHADALRWVDEGLRYHESHSLKDCLLCGNPLLDDRKSQLRLLFDDSWNVALQALEEALKEGRGHQQSLRDLYRSIPKELEIAAEHRVIFRKERERMEIAIKRLGVCLGQLVSALEEKHGSPSRQIGIAGDVANFDLENWLMDYSLIQTALVKIFSDQNEASALFASRQREAFSRIESHVLATNQTDWDRQQERARDAESDSIAARADVSRLAARQTELRNSLEDHGVGADKLNELIWSYLGHRELRLIADDGGYRILRPSGHAATELSEGERTAVSFCYFLTQLGAEGRKLENLVLVIDDPISSLDTSARTHAYSLMMRMTKKCSQVIVLTHNTSFMNMVKREFQNRQKRDQGRSVALLTLDCRSAGEGRERSTSLAHMSSLLVHHDSEYHYLFRLVQDAAQRKTTDYHFLLPNATRKLLEMFSTFCSPGQSSFAGALMDHHEKVKDIIDVRALERLVQIESHGSMDGLSNLPELTIEEAIRAAEACMIFIKEIARDHYKKMCAAVTG